MAGFFTGICKEKEFNLDCRSVTRKLVNYIEDIQMPPAAQVHWTMCVVDTNENHWVVKWNDIVLDPTILQFYNLGEKKAEFITRWFGTGKDVKIVDCWQDDERGYHQNWPKAQVERGEAYQRFKETIIEAPYFIGKAEEHPLYIYKKN